MGPHEASWESDDSDLDNAMQNNDDVGDGRNVTGWDPNAPKTTQVMLRYGGS